MKYIIIFFFLISFLISFQSVSAQPSTGDDGSGGSTGSTPPPATPSEDEGGSASCTRLGQAPSACPSTFITDLDCVNRKILEPSLNCCENICPGGQTVGSPELYSKLEAFGATILIKEEDMVVSLINIAVTTVLGASSLYALIRGVYINAYKGAKTTDAGELEAISNESRNLVIGFILSWSFIFIIQLVLGVLGLGSINDMVLIGEQQDSNVIVIN